MPLMQVIRLVVVWNVSAVLAEIATVAGFGHHLSFTVFLDTAVGLLLTQLLCLLTGRTAAWGWLLGCLTLAALQAALVGIAVRSVHPGDAPRLWDHVPAVVLVPCGTLLVGNHAVRFWRTRRLLREFRYPARPVPTRPSREELSNVEHTSTERPST